MKHLNRYIALMLMLIFCSYSAGISLFSHTHIINGASLVHSHLGGDSDHEHTESQYTVIEILSHFQSESVDCFYKIESPVFLSSELYIGYVTTPCISGASSEIGLRGPPMA